MTVAELIAELSKCKPGARVVYYQEDYIIDVKFVDPDERLIPGKAPSGFEFYYSSGASHTVDAVLLS